MKQNILFVSVQSFLTVPDGLTGEAAREYLFFKLAYPAAVISHASWALIFFLNGLSFLSYYNIVVSILFTIGGFFWRRNRNSMWLIVTLWIFEIQLHALLGTLYAGFQTLFWAAPLISATTCLITPKLSWSKRVVFAVLAVAAAFILGLLTFYMAPISPLSTGSNIYLFASNFLGILGALTFIVGVNQYIAQAAESRLTKEFDRAEGLLRNILPGSIALHLKDGERVIANNHKEVSIIFADIVDFTTASAKLSPAELVETLDIVFSKFDILAEKHGAEKIKTIGDAYMVVLGAPDAQRNHAEAAVDLALDMQKAATALNEHTHFNVRLRIGINSGPVVAGVIGKRKFSYDIWGDTVNVASRMESHGVPGQILTTETTANLLPEKFLVSPEGMREIKGKGPTPVFSVTRPV